MTTTRALSLLVAAVGLLAACGSDDDGGSTTQAEVIARGKYLADHVANCNICHTTWVNGKPDTTRYFGGFKDRFTIAGVGFISAPNITPDKETGIGNWTDEEIKRAIRTGIRKDGTIMWDNMAYWDMVNITEPDLDAIVAYLHTVPALKSDLPVRVPVPDRTAPYKLITLSMLPQTTLATTDAKYARAQNGRYLASFACMSCHTMVTTGDYPRDTTKLLAGNRKFAPSVPLSYTTTAYSANLTPHANGIAELSAAQVKESIRTGSGILCAPMPAGPDRAFGGMTDDDAMDLAIYLTTLPPVDTGVIPKCM